MCWINVYLDPPNMIFHDTEKIFMGASFQGNTDMFHIRTKSVQVESANSMSITERYNALIRRAFIIITKEAPDIGREEGLQMAV